MFSIAIVVTHIAEVDSHVTDLLLRWNHTFDRIYNMGYHNCAHVSCFSMFKVLYILHG